MQNRILQKNFPDFLFFYKKKGEKNGMKKMERMSYLVMVCPDANNNKFYRMTGYAGEPSFTVEYGRIGSRGMTRRYPLSEWYRKYDEKIAKGYLDKTNSYIINSSLSISGTNYAQIDNPCVKSFIDRLLYYADQKIRQSYTIDVADVTEHMVLEAQALIDLLYNQESTTSFNKILVDLFIALPRKMKLVDNYLLASMDDKYKVISREQDLLDVMKAQVRIREKVHSSQTILEAHGLSVTLASDKQEKEVLSHLKDQASNVAHIYSVRNTKTESNFQKYCKARNISQSDFLYHGSLNENYWGILEGGMSLNPNARITGKMFGQGLYFATNPKKSMRYTSLPGCNNVHPTGNENSGILSVFKVATGTPLDVTVWNRKMYDYDEKTIRAMGYDSLFAHKGVSLVNDEIIVYNKCACTIRYLIEMKN